MKRILAMLLTLVILLSLAPSVGLVADAAVSTKPFVAMTWDHLNGEKFSNIDRALVLEVKPFGDQLTLAGQKDPAALAQTVKATLNARPDGMRYIRLFKTGAILSWDADYVVYADGGVKEFRKYFDAFIKAYHEIDGKLDGIILDTEYTAMGSWYLYGDPYGGHYEKNAAPGSNRNLYHDIVNHPNYKTDIRPLLVEAGFKFYEEIGGDRSEIWSMYPPQTIKQVLKGTAKTQHLEKYAGCYEIWNKVMYNRQAMYFNYAIYEPMKALYPNATMSDYQSNDANTWYKNVTSYTNDMKTGNVSNSNDYSHLPSASYFKDGSTYLYQTPASYNNAVYDDDPYGMLLWNINKFKNIYESTDTKKISVWISKYDYSSRKGSYAGNTAYYTESLYHYGMLDPQPFLVYMTVSEGGGQAGYDQRLKYMNEAMVELTRVAGYSDRKPISVPVNWNDGYLLSGSYANGRNIWRITPDTTGGTTLASFKVKDNDPTFRINGTTVTFPGGKIIPDKSVSLGSSGYWVETAKNVNPVVTRDADRYEKNPSYMETFSYADNTAFNGETAKEKQAWEVSGKAVVQNGALTLTGTTTVKNVKLPKNVTAADSFAKHQAWEVSVTLSKDMNSGSKVVLLNTPKDGGFKLEGGKVYYDEYEKYVEIEGVSLAAGKKYTFKRDMNFADKRCTYSIYADGKLVKQVADIYMNVPAPVDTISMSCSDLSTQVLIDDYKLYPTGLAVEMAVYDYYGGEKLSMFDKHAKAQVGYRLSWMNATSEKQTIKLKAACYDSSNGVVSDTVIATVNMLPGEDAVLTGSVVNKGAKIRIYVEGAEDIVTESPSDGSEDAGDSDATTSTSPTKTTKATKATKATQALTKPTKASKATRPPKATKPGETLKPDATVAAGATEETLVPGETVAPENNTNPDATDATTATSDEKKDGKGRMLLLVAIGAVAVLAVAGGLIGFLVKKKPATAVIEEPVASESPETIEETEVPKETEAPVVDEAEFLDDNSDI